MFGFVVHSLYPRPYVKVVAELTAMLVRGLCVVCRRVRRTLPCRAHAGAGFGATSPRDGVQGRALLCG